MSMQFLPPQSQNAGALPGNAPINNYKAVGSTQAGQVLAGVTANFFPPENLFPGTNSLVARMFLG